MPEATLNVAGLNTKLDKLTGTGVLVGVSVGPPGVMVTVGVMVGPAVG